MDYINERVAVGMLMMNDEGYDEMGVIQGTILKNENGYYLDSEGHEPFEMSENWLSRLTPVEESLGPKFQGAKYCLIIGSLQKPE